MARDTHAAVLAGGSGTRFWPLSREESPKQMLTVFGGEDGDSLLVQAVQRAATIVTGEGLILIVVCATMLDETRNHLSSRADLAGLPLRFVVEPVGRNTTAAIALAAATLKNIDPDGTLVIMPSDHLIETGEEWRRAMAAAVATARTGDLVVLGIAPTAPSTAYGYIEIGEEIAPSTAARESSHRVARFVEKPDPETAAGYLAAGRYLWNSGMVVATPRAILKQMRTVGSEVVGPGDVVYHGDNVRIAGAAEMIADMGDGNHANPAATHIYSSLPSVQFDHAVLELTSALAVVPARFSWSDVGSLTALEALVDPDASGNRSVGRGVQIDSSQTLTYAPERLVATLGVENLVVVDTPDATLIASRDRVEDVRLVVDALRAADAPELRQSKKSLRPWGSWTMLVRADGYHVKEIEVLPGARLSLQSHERRAEHWMVVEGRARVERGDETLELAENESVFVPIGAKHRLENVGTSVLRVVEVATGEYLGEDDITRYDDDFGRSRP